VVISAELRTSIAPPLRIGLEDLAGGGGGRPPLLVRLLRPSLTVRTPLGELHEAPAGDPGDAWALVLAGAAAALLVVLALAGVGVWKLARS
jgi:hypothetical protein